MDKCSYFIEGVALFGSYPTQEFVDHLVANLNIEYFIDLTEKDDKNIVRYTTSKHISYPIKDKNIPDNTFTFSSFILGVLELIKANKKIYVHCRGGHGRSGIVVACLIKMYYDIDVNKALDLTYECHQKRRVMRDKWRQIGSPQTSVQKNFVRTLFSPVYYNNYNKDNNYLSNYYTSRILIHIDGKDINFLNVEACYQALKNKTNTEYIKLLSDEINPRIAKLIGRMFVYNDDWKYERVKIMKDLVYQKFSQNSDLRNKLLSTGLGEIIKISGRTTYWNSIYHNRMGLILTQIRNELLLELGHFS